MDYSALFEPKSIAIIGASTKKGSVGNDIAKNLVEQGFQGNIYLINPKASELYGKKTYGKIGEIESEVDMAIIVVPATIVPSVAKEAVEKGVKSMVVISAGFREVGNEEGERVLQEMCDESDVALLGPNCLGVINPHVSMNASFATRMPQKGNVAFLSQSGALCTAVLDYASTRSVGFSRFASMGNKAQTDEAALMNYLVHDEETKLVVLYVEALRRSARFIESVRALRASGKAVLVLKSGRTRAGANASASHTGSLAGDDAIYDALFEQAGAIRVETVQEMFSAMSVFSLLPDPKGKRVAVLTNAGGPGVLTTDSAVERGLDLAKLSKVSIQKLEAFLPLSANVHGPIDVLGDAKADRYAQALDVLLEDENVDSVMVVLTPQSMTEIEETARVIASRAGQTQKPIVASFMGQTDVSSGLDILQAGGVPSEIYPQPLMGALAAYIQFSLRLQDTPRTPFTFADIDVKEIERIFDEARKNGKTSFPEADALTIFRNYGFKTLKSISARSTQEAEKAAEEIDGEVALKIISQDILHKSDVQGIELGVHPNEAGEKYTHLLKRVAEKAPKARLDGALVVEMGPKGGQEFILGSSKDPNLGSVVMVGFGGIYVELYRDVTFGIVPISREDARNMVRRLVSYKLIEGMRGEPRLDEEALVESIGRISQMLLDHPNIKEIDINPLLVLPEGQGVRVLDARVILDSE